MLSPGEQAHQIQVPHPAGEWDFGVADFTVRITFETEDRGTVYLEAPIIRSQVIWPCSTITVCEPTAKIRFKRGKQALASLARKWLKCLGLRRVSASA
jgi:hypothetical protein